jgi:hypothetical protein
MPEHRTVICVAGPYDGKRIPLPVGTDHYDVILADYMIPDDGGDPVRTGVRQVRYEAQMWRVRNKDGSEWAREVLAPAGMTMTDVLEHILTTWRGSCAED